MANFHSLGSSCKSIQFLNKTDNGKARESRVFRKRTGGSWSGPAAELVLSFFMIGRRILGVIVISLIPMGGVVVGSREGKVGRVPSSLMKTDSKYSLRRLAFSRSDAKSMPELL
jgi:hypothetical protein